MPYLLGLTGLAGVGKDTIGDRLFANHDFVQTSFAEPLRGAAMEVFGLNYQHFADRELKHQVVPYWGLTPRQMLQRLGTEAIRNTFGADFWVRRWLQTYEEVAGQESVVVTDVRFLEEAQMVRERGGVIVHVIREVPDLEGDHASARGIAMLAGDYILENDSDMKGLYEKVDEMMAWLKGR